MLDDTIHALASPPGAAERAVLRLSGPRALAAANAVFSPRLPRVRAQREGRVAVFDGEPAATVEALALAMPGPHSYTGEDVVELHLPGGPLLAATVVARMHERLGAPPGGGSGAAPVGGSGAPPGSALRPALPGEFTRRALTNGRLDLAQAEGVLLLIHGENEAAARRGLAWLRGGLSAGTAAARARLQDALAALEGGLDFLPEETGAVDDAAWLAPLAAACAALDEFAAALPEAAPGGEILLLGRANAGKSSLANALLGREELLVDAAPGTTRDLLRVELALGTALWDAPGDLDEPAAIDQAALALRDRLGAQAAGALLVADPAAPSFPPSPVPVLALVFTRRDLGVPPPPRQHLPAALAALPTFWVRCTRGDGSDGIADLRAFLLARPRGGSALAAGTETAAAITAARAAAGRALAAGRGGLPHELVCTDLQAALAALDRIDGSHSPEAVLDRIFGRFCLGK